ncbi:helix-turn-helix domain-containing protein [Bosea sp. TAB14]|uniref:helix-turn-helix domain-containing protein n=1 Tax=Bosea sp. TAB14 TaxID=3237481 RepID=UPI003F902951
MLTPVSQMHSLREVASRINSGVDLPGILFDLVKAACDHGGWSMGSIMSIDVGHGYAHVSVRHDPTLLRRQLEDRWELATSPALLALRTGEPVYIPDARASEEFPGYRREAFERDYRSVLVMPLTSVDAEGRPMVLSLISRDIKPLPSDDLAFMGMIAHLGAIAVEREQRLWAERRAAEEQRRALHAQGALLQEVLSGGSADALAARLDELLRCAVLVVDFAENGLVAAGSPAPVSYDEAAWRTLLATGQADPVIATVKAAVADGEAKIGSISIDAGGGKLVLPALIEPLSVDADIVGALVLFDAEPGDDLRRLMLDSAKFALSVQMMRSVIQFRPGPPRQHGLSCHVITIGTGLVCLLPAQAGEERERLDRFAQRLVETLRHGPRGEPIAVIGGVCDGLDAYSGEWERAWRMLRIARSFRRSGVLSALDFGPLPMLIGAADSAEVRAFVEGSIGRVASHDREHGTPYLETLTAYLRAGCRSQPCADAMALHVTTLRYRLARIEELFQINPDTPERRFTLELALKMHDVIEGRTAAYP